MNSVQLLYEYILEDSALINGSEMRFNCPFCGEEKQKFYVSLYDKHGYPAGVFQCKHCEESGNVITFIMKFYEIPYSGAKEFLDDWNNDSDIDIGLTVQEDKGESLIQKLLMLNNDNKEQRKEAPTKLVLPKLPSNVQSLTNDYHKPQAQPYIQYLAGRGFGYNEIVQYNILYVTDGLLYMESTGKTLSVRNSIIFITYNELGNPIYWNTRCIAPNPIIKSINAPAVENVEYSRRDVVFNANRLCENNLKGVIINEGVFNALTVDTQEYAGVATFGKQVTEHQVDLLLSGNVSNFYIFLDNDAPQQIYNLTMELIKRGISKDNIYVVMNPYKGKDANDLGLEKSYQLIYEAPKANLVTLLEMIQQAKN